jgi:hypothetical protein
MPRLHGTWEEGERGEDGDAPKKNVVTGKQLHGKALFPRF